MTAPFLRVFLAASALAAAAAPAAQAQTWTGGATLGFGRTTLDGADGSLRNTSLDGTIAADLGNGFSLGADLSLNRLSSDGDDLNATLIGLSGAYSFGGGFSVGAYVERASLDIDLLGDDLTATSYGLTAGYAQGPLRAGLFIGMTETDPDLPDGVDVRDFGIIVHYQASPELHFGGSLVRTTIDGFGDSADLTAFGIGAAYDVAPDWTVFGGIARTSVSEIDADVTSFGLGVSYDTSAAFRFPSFVSLELARTNASLDGDDADLDTVRIGLTIPLGEGARVPLNSVAHTAMNPRRNALSSTLLAAF